ncbi:MAG: hypothetical protein ACK4Z5_03040 [Brevundimonas sp.]
MRRAFAVLIAAAFAATPVAAQDAPVETRHTLPGYQPSAMERAIDDAESGDFERRAEALAAAAQSLTDGSLSEEERQARWQAAWAEFQPHFHDYAAGAGEMGVNVAANMLATMNIGAMVENALAGVTFDDPEIAAEVEAALVEMRAELQAADAEIAAARAEMQAELAAARAQAPSAQ